MRSKTDYLYVDTQRSESKETLFTVFKHGAFRSANALDVSINSVALSSPASPRTKEKATSDINIKSTNVPLSPTFSAAGGVKRSFFNRTFGKLEKGSVRGSIFNLCSAALGGGVLSLSWVFVLSGWVVGFCLIFVGTFANIWSNILITNAAIDNDLKNYDEIAMKAGG